MTFTNDNKIDFKNRDHCPEDDPTLSPASFATNVGGTLVFLALLAAVICAGNAILEHVMQGGVQ